MTLFNGSYADTLYRLKPARFDVSNSIIFIPVKSVSKTAISNNLKITKSEDNFISEILISNASADSQPEDVFFSEGNIKEFKIFKSGTDICIRLVMKDKNALSALKIKNIDNNIVISQASIPPYNMNYYINTYRDSDGGKDYLEALSLTTKDVIKQAAASGSNEKALTEINSAFSDSNAGANGIYTNYVVNDISKTLALRSKYYVSDIKVVDSVFKINGVGTVCLQEPFILESPLRIVFDIPNTTINSSIHNKEYKLSNGDILKLAQFNKNMARMVITSKQAKQYIPVYSADSQSLLVTNPKYLLTSHLPDYKANIVKFNYQKADKVNNFLFEFDKPLVYSIKRNSNEMYLYFLNAEKYNDTNFHSAIKSTPYSDMSIHLLSTGMRVKFSLQNKVNVNTYISPDGKVFKISTEPKTVVEEKPKKDKDKTKEKEKIPTEIATQEGTITKSSKYTSLNNHNVVVIDAGHGGSDCGAIRENLYEKTINLDVCNKLKAVLQKKGYRVYMTRTDDTYVSLEDRTIFTEDIFPAVFVSVHVNSCNAESPKGIETHYYHDNSIELADCVHKKLMSKITNTNDRGLFKSRFYVINHTTVPAILVEIGFISNPSERAELITPRRQQLTAEGIAEGIIEYLKNTK